MTSDTPADRDPAFAAWWNAQPSNWLVSQQQHLRLAEAAWNAARAEEREACARLAEEVGATYLSCPCDPARGIGDPSHGPDPFADLIRARTTP